MNNEEFVSRFCTIRLEICRRKSAQKEERPKHFALTFESGEEAPEDRGAGHPLSVVDHDDDQDAEDGLQGAEGHSGQGYHRHIGGRRKGHRSKQAYEHAFQEGKTLQV